MGRIINCLIGLAALLGTVSLLPIFPRQVGNRETFKVISNKKISPELREIITQNVESADTIPAFDKNKLPYTFLSMDKRWAEVKAGRNYIYYETELNNFWGIYFHSGINALDNLLASGKGMVLKEVTPQQ